MALTKVKGHIIADDLALGGNPTTSTQSASDNSTKIATTAYVTTAVSNLVDGAPSTLNTLNEIAAALNDDAALNTTLTTSIATKLPLAGGTLTGNILIDNSSSASIGLDRGNDTSGSTIDFKTAGTVKWYMGLRGLSNDNFYLRNEAGSTNALTILTNGNVGIGVASPSSILDIRGSGNVDMMSKIINTQQTSDGRKTEFLFGKDNGANLSGVLKYIYDGTQADRRIDLVHYQTTNGISILDGGNVGIGTNSPAKTLDVKGRMQLTRPVDSGHASEGNWDFNISHEDAARYGSLYITPSVSTAEISLMSNKFRFTNGGNLGIGLSSGIDEKLHIKNGALKIEHDSHPVIYLEDVGNSTSQIGVSGQGSGTDGVYIAGYNAIANSTYDFKITGSSGQVNLRQNLYVGGGHLEVGSGSSTPGALYIHDTSGTAYTLGILSTNTRTYEFRGSSSGAAYNTSFTNPGGGGHNVNISGLTRVTSGNLTVTSGARICFDDNGDTFMSEYSANELGIYTGGGQRMKFSGGNVYVVGGGILPSSDNAQDLGTATARWRDIYTGDLHLSNEGREGGNEVDGTTGNWSIQEGEEHLYLINNNNGKKFKFALEEIT